MNSLSIGAGVEQLYAIKCAQHMGLKVIAVDQNPNAPGMYQAELSKALSTAYADDIVSLARVHEVQLILPTPIGRFLTTTGRVNDQLGLTGISEAAALNCVDKYRAHQLLHEVHVPVAEQLLVTNPASFSLHCQLPVLVKPRFGSGSRGVRVCHTMPEVLSALSYNVDDSLVESMVYGIEYGVDGAVFNQHADVWLLRRKLVTADPYRVDTGYIVVNEPSDAISKTIQAAVRALGLNNCLFHADIIVDEQEVVHIIELSGRPSGMNISTKLLPFATGIDLIAAVISYHLGRSPFPSPPPPKRPAALVYFPLPAGTINTIGNAATAVEWPGVVELNLPFRVGEIFARPSGCCTDFLRRGYALLTGATEQELTTLIDEVRNYIAQEVHIVSQ